MTGRQVSLGQQLAAFAAAPGQVPAAAIDIARWQLLLSVAASVAGSGTPQTAVVGRAWAGDRGSCTAFRNATAAFTESPQSADPVGRTIRTVIVPALCAGGGGELLSALAVAAEVICRLYTVLEPALSARRTPVHTVLGPLGAAVAVARAAGGTAAQIANAIAVAGSLACGAGEIADAGSGAYLAGWAAQSGLLAGQLGIRGFTGPAEALEGERGLFKAFADGWDSVAAPVLHGLGVDWLLLDLVRPDDALADVGWLAELSQRAVTDPVSGDGMAFPAIPVGLRERSSDSPS
jgi:hypothetical protein